MLDTLPPEILTHIAFHLVLDSCAPPVPLLVSCRSVYAAVSPQTNPNLYAQVFREAYDVAAPTRRLLLGTGSVEDDGEDNGTAEADERRWREDMSPSPADSMSSMTPAARRPPALHPRQLLTELRTRTRTLSRLRHRPDELYAEDLWVVYLMLLENDGKNITHLVKPLAPGPGVDMVNVMGQYHLRTLIGHSQYPHENVVDALAMWIAWFLDEHYSSRTVITLRGLRPYVFAAHKYELFFAPWILLQLPATPEQSSLSGPFVVDRVPRSRACRVPSYGRELHLATPLLSHAAMLRFFGGPQDPDEPSSASNGTRSDFAFDVSAADLRALPRPLLNSAAHDADYARLLACHDGRRSPGRRISDWRGVFDGAWEGTFTFLDFDAFRDMLGGGDGGRRAVYGGPYGEQAQVWKLRETFVRPRADEPGPAPATAMATAGRRGLPLHGPMTHAGFPKDMREFSADPISARAPGTSPEDAMIDDAVDRQLLALPGYERVPDDELEAAIAAADAVWEVNRAAHAGAGAGSAGKGKGKAPAAAGPTDGGADTGLGLLVTGVGHSAWGRFVISGHVRVWDGLVYLVKEYAPYQRGMWVYRGYVVSRDIMLGRWRDTFTHEDYVGYEGTFILNRR